MKSLYAKYGDSYYQLNERINANIYPSINTFATTTANTVVVDKNDEITIDLKMGIIGDSLKTNKEMAEQMVKDLTEAHANTLDVLEPFFEVVLDFTLYNADNETVLDDGVIRRHVKNIDQNFYYMLGIDVTDEMYTRVVKKLDTAFNLNYRESNPCGIMNERKKNFILKIHSIKIHQILHDPDFMNDLNDRFNNWSKSTEGVAITRESYSKNYNRPKDVVVYDSEVSGVEFKEIQISHPFRKVNINFSAILNNYILFHTEETINNIIGKENFLDTINGSVLLGGDACEEDCDCPDSELDKLG